MGIQNFPAALQPIIQQNFLEREFEEGLSSLLGYRAIADRETVAVHNGETVTKTRAGLKAPTTTPMDPSQNTNLDNGLTASDWTVEQYTLAINMYGDTIDLNTVTQRVGIADRFMRNAHVNGVQAAQSLDRLARDALFGAYMGGNTRVTTTLSTAGTTVAVNDIRGFQYVFSNGVLVPVSSTHTMPVSINGTNYTLTGVAADGTNVSTSPNGVSGTLTFSGNVTVADGTAGNAVVGGYAPSVFRPGGRATSEAITSADTLTMSTIIDAVTQLRNNNVPDIDGHYNLYLDPSSARGLFADNEFQLLYRGATGANQTYRAGEVIEILGARLIPTTEAYQETNAAGVKVHRPIMCGAGALIEGDFEDMEGMVPDNNDSVVSMVDSVVQVTREPLDRLQQIIAQSWYWIGGYAVPTDQTADKQIIPTASSSYYKRGVLIECA